jgi:hypothetical protein
MSWLDMLRVPASRVSSNNGAHFGLAPPFRRAPSAIESALAQSHSGLASVGKLQTGGFEYLPETVNGALAEPLAPLKPDNGIRGHFRGGRQFLDA